MSASPPPLLRHTAPPQAASPPEGERRSVPTHHRTGPPYPHVPPSFPPASAPAGFYNSYADARVAAKQTTAATPQKQQVLVGGQSVATWGLPSSPVTLASSMASTSFSSSLIPPSISSLSGSVDVRCSTTTSALASRQARERGGPRLPPPPLASPRAAAAVPPPSLTTVGGKAGHPAQHLIPTSSTSSPPTDTYSVTSSPKGRRRGAAQHTADTANRRPVAPSTGSTPTLHHDDPVRSSGSSSSYPTKSDANHQPNETQQQQQQQRQWDYLNSKYEAYMLHPSASLRPSTSESSMWTDDAVAEESSAVLLYCAADPYLVPSPHPANEHSATASFGVGQRRLACPPWYLHHPGAEPPQALGAAGGRLSGASPTGSGGPPRRPPMGCWLCGTSPCPRVILGLKGLENGAHSAVERVALLWASRLSLFRLCERCRHAIHRKIASSSSSGKAPASALRTNNYAPLVEILEWLWEQGREYRALGPPPQHSVAFVYFLRLYALLQERVGDGLAQCVRGAAEADEKELRRRMKLEETAHPSGEAVDREGWIAIAERQVDQGVSSSVLLLQRCLVMDATAAGATARLTPVERYQLLSEWRQMETAYLYTRTTATAV